MQWFESKPEQPVEPEASSSSSWLSFSGWTSSSNESAVLCGLSYRQRLTLFICSFGLACVFFFLASMTIVMPVKFAKLFFLGSIFLVSSWAFLVGPMALVLTAFQRDRIVASLGYLGSATATMVCAVYLESSLLTLIALVVQFGCAAWLALSFLPFGQSFLGLAARQLLPI